MSEIDLNRPIEYRPDKDEWHAITWHRVMPGGELVFEYAGSWDLIVSPKNSTALRNKPEPRVRPYTFEEAKRFVGTPVIDSDGNYALILRAFRLNDESAVIMTSDCDDSLGTDEVLSHYKHPDGTPFGVVENE